MPATKALINSAAAVLLFCVYPNSGNNNSCTALALRSPIRPRSGVSTLRASWIDEQVSLEVPAASEAAYSLYSDLRRQPEWSPWLKSVEHNREEGTSEWVIQARGLKVSWNARNTVEIPGSEVAWESTTGLNNRGRVTFEDRGQQRCFMTLTLSYNLPGVVASVLRIEAVERFVKGTILSDLKRFKTVLARQPGVVAARAKTDAAAAGGGGSAADIGKTSTTTTMADAARVNSGTMEGRTATSQGVVEGLASNDAAITAAAAAVSSAATESESSQKHARGEKEDDQEEGDRLPHGDKKTGARQSSQEAAAVDRGEGLLERARRSGKRDNGAAVVDDDDSSSSAAAGSSSSTSVVGGQGGDGADGGAGKSGRRRTRWRRRWRRWLRRDGDDDGIDGRCEDDTRGGVSQMVEEE